MMKSRSVVLLLILASIRGSQSFVAVPPLASSNPSSPHKVLLANSAATSSAEPDRRTFLTSLVTSAATVAIPSSFLLLHASPAMAIGPVKIALSPLSYVARPCPPSKPIPGQMAMRGMRGLCVTVQATLSESTPKPLQKVGVYGFVTDGETGDSVLANNPDLSTDAGQFAMIETVQTTDKQVRSTVCERILHRVLSPIGNGAGERRRNSSSATTSLRRHLAVA